MKKIIMPLESSLDGILFEHVAWISLSINFLEAQDAHIYWMGFKPILAHNKYVEQKILFFVNLSERFLHFLANFKTSTSIHMHL